MGSHGRTLPLSEKCVGPKKSSAATGDVTLFFHGIMACSDVLNEAPA